MYLVLCSSIPDVILLLDVDVAPVGDLQLPGELCYSGEGIIVFKVGCVWGRCRGGQVLIWPKGQHLASPLCGCQACQAQDGAAGQLDLHHRGGFLLDVLSFSQHLLTNSRPRQVCYFLALKPDRHHMDAPLKLRMVLLHWRGGFLLDVMVFL